MNSSALKIAIFAIAGALSGCGQDASAPTKEPSSTATTQVAMDDMAMPADAKMAKGTGVVTAVDAAAGTITLDHQAMPEVQWPAMVMTFSAKSELLEGAQVGDKVVFDAKIKPGVAEVMAISKQ